MLLNVVKALAQSHNERGDIPIRFENSELYRRKKRKTQTGPYKNIRA